MNTTCKTTLGLSCLALLSGCLTIDPLPPLEASGEARSSVALADYCTGEVPVATASMDPSALTTVGLSDSVHIHGACGFTSNHGDLDGFVAVEMLAGERWHMMARPADDEELDLSAFVLSSCDERACERGRNQCGPGGAEHINFLAEQSGLYFFGVESSGPGEVMLMLLNPPCGNGIVDHGETCDDGNSDEGDGCTPDCQAELWSGSAEVEPNDDNLEANHVRLSSGTVTVKGTLGGFCDVDRFVFDVPEDGSVTALMRLLSQQPCGEAQQGAWMALEHVTSSGKATAMGLGATGRAGGACPTIEETDAFATNLGAGHHSISVGAPPGSDLFAYELDITVHASGVQ